MDINEALAELRGAFKRVTWTATEDEPGSWTIRGGGLMIWDYSAGWMCQDKVAPTPLLAVRAWLSAQLTAAFYPEVQSGETIECHGALVMYDRDTWGLAGFSSKAPGTDAVGVAHELADLDEHREAFTVYPIVVRVPVPVEPPALVGEVSDV